MGCCHACSSAGSSKIKIRTSSTYKSKLALYGDEVRILNFEDPAEPKAWKRPGSESRKMSNPRGRAAHAMHEIFPGNLRNPAHDRRAGAMCQFPTDQVYSTTAVPCTCKCTLQMVILPTWHLRTWTSQACTLQMANPYGRLQL